MTIRRIEPLGLGELLGSLMGSLVAAQHDSAQSTVEFIDTVGFTEDEDGISRLQTVHLRYEKLDARDQRAPFQLEVPLLAMVNIPSLAIQRATLSFSYDVVSASAGDDHGGGTGPQGPFAKLNRPGAPVITGVLRSRRTDAPAYRSTTNIDVEVVIEQQPPAIGVERLFDLAELAIGDSQIDEGDVS